MILRSITSYGQTTCAAQLSENLGAVTFFRPLAISVVKAWWLSQLLETLERACPSDPVRQELPLMSLSSWHRGALKRLIGPNPWPRKTKVRHNARPKLHLENLEERQLLSGGVTFYDFPPLNYNGTRFDHMVFGFAVGPDNNLYFGDVEAGAIGRITPDGHITEFPVGNAYTGDFAFGPNGKIWYPTFDNGQFKLEVLDPATGNATGVDPNVPKGLPDSASLPNLQWFGLYGHAYWFSSTGALNEFPSPTSDGQATFLSKRQSPDGNVWFVDGHTIGRMTFTGQVAEFPIPPLTTSPFLGLNGFAVGSDHNLWILVNVDSPRHDVIERLTPDGVYTTFTLPDGPGHFGLSTAGDGSIIFNEGSNTIDRLNPLGDPNQFVSYHLTVSGTPLIGAPDGSIWFFVAGQAPDFHTQFGRLDPGALPDASNTFVSTAQGSPFGGVVTTVSLPDPANATATIDWGNGQVTPATLVPNQQGSFNVVGSNTYMAVGTYSIAITVNSTSGAVTVFHGSAQVQVSPNGHFLDQVYQQLLHRAADSVGINEWLTAMNRGMTRAQVVAQIETSDEYRRDLVISYYQTYLARTPSDAEVTPWVQFLAGGTTQEQMKVQFLSSPEYAMRAGSTASGLLQAIYRDVLGRDVDPTGRADWLPLLGNANSLPTAIDLILRSPETEWDLVRGYYQQYLGREADQAGLVNWSNVLATRGEEAVQAGILGSDEFFVRT